MNTEELKKLAMAATPGPWVAEVSWQSTFLEGKHDGKWAIRKSNTSFGFAPLAYVKGDKRITGGDGALNAQFIAAANPTAILALIEQHEAAHSELLATRDDNHSMMLEIHNLRIERDEAIAKLERAQAEIRALESRLLEVEK